MSIRVQLQQFEGPLDLLLYLIRKEEMDIFNINVVEITKQYFDYIKLMKEFDLEIAGDFIAMASTLIHIKSKMLLPQYDENGEIVEQEDPRKELVQKLLEYEKFKEASKSLYERPLLNRDVWARGFREKLEVVDDEIELEENALFSLIGSYRKAMKTLTKKVHKVTVKLQSISSRIMEMGQYIRPGHSIRMSDLLWNTGIGDQLQRSRQALITFLSLLELGKLGFVGLYQTDNYGEIHIQGRKEIDGDVLSRVEEYGHINNEEVAQNLFAKSATEAEEIEAARLDAELAFEKAEENAQLAFDAQINGELNGTLGDLNFEEMASDDEILAAELEFEAQTGTEVSVEEAPVAQESDVSPESEPGHEPEANV